MSPEPGPAGLCVTDAQGPHWVSTLWQLLGPHLWSVPHCNALQPGQAPASAMTTGLGIWGSEQTLFANFVYCLIRKTWPALANSGSGHIWGKGVTWIQSRMRF